MKLKDSLVMKIVEKEWIQKAQIIELMSFMISGFLFLRDNFLSALVLVFALYMALITGEAMELRKEKEMLKEMGGKNGGS